MKSIITLILFYLTIFISACGLIGNNRKVNYSDYPKELSSKIDTIEVTYIAWACDCANWLPTHYLDNPLYQDSVFDHQCIFLEAKSEELMIPDEYRKGGNTNKIRLVGSYYMDEGISKDYMQITPSKPDKAKVFKYSKIEIIKPYTVWDFSTENSETNTKLIKTGMKAFYEK